VGYLEHLIEHNRTLCSRNTRNSLEHVLRDGSMGFEHWFQVWRKCAGSLSSVADALRVTE
jgi:hypothetical protein